MPTHPTMLPLGCSEAAMFLQSSEAHRVRALISIHGTNEHGVETTAIPRLDLDFHDVIMGDPADPVAQYHGRMRLQAAAADGWPRTPPTLDHARAILDFAETLRHTDGILLCHCSGGISRSPAAALLCLAQWTGPGHEHDCVRTLEKIRPTASPNLDLIRFGDTLLQRQGKLLAAVNEILFGEGTHEPPP